MAVLTRRLGVERPGVLVHGSEGIPRGKPANKNQNPWLKREKGRRRRRRQRPGRRQERKGSAKKRNPAPTRAPKTRARKQKPPTSSLSFFLSSLGPLGTHPGSRIRRLPPGARSRARPPPWLVLVEVKAGGAQSRRWRHHRQARRADRASQLSCGPPARPPGVLGDGAQPRGPARPALHVRPERR